MKTLILLFTFTVLHALAWPFADKLTTESATPMNTTNWGTQLDAGVPEETISLSVKIDNGYEGNKIAAFVVKQKRSENEGSNEGDNPVDLTIHVNPSDIINFYYYDNGTNEVYPVKEALIYDPDSESQISIINYFDEDILPIPYDGSSPLILTKSDQPIVIIESNGAVCPDDTSSASLYIFGIGEECEYILNGNTIPVIQGVSEGIISTIDAIPLNSLTSGTHGITVTTTRQPDDENDTIIEEVTREVTIETYEIPTIGLNDYSHQYDCHGKGTLTINNITGVTSYTFNNQTNDNGIFTFQSSNNIPNQVSLSYGDNCNTNLELNIPIYEKITLDVPNNVTLACHNDATSITLDASGGTGDLMYSIDNGSTFQSENTFTVDANSDIMAVVEDSDDCNSDVLSVIVLVNQNSPLILNPIPSSLDIECTTVDIELEAIGGNGNYTYSIYQASVDTTVTVGSDIISLSAGTYDIWITSGNCETERQTVTVNSADSPLAIMNPDELDNIVIPCNGGDTIITVNAMGGTAPSGEMLMYQYKVGGGGTYSDDNTFPLGYGMHTIYVTDNSGCEISHEIIIEQTLQSLTVDVINEDNLYIPCHGESIEVTFTPNGGTGEGYEYSVNEGIFTSENTATLPEGNHSVVLKDNSGCETAPNNFYIDETDVQLFLTLPNNGTVEIPCHDGTKEVELEADGGTGSGYLYTIVGSDMEEITQPHGKFNLSGGTYQATVKDDSHCTTEVQTLTVNQPDEPISIAFNEVINSCNEDASGSIEIEVKGGKTPYSYKWSNQEETTNIYSLSIGDYWVTVTDARSCSEVSETVTIVSGEDLIVLADTIHATCSTVNNGSINLSHQNGTPPYTYMWSHDDNLDNWYAENLYPDTYNVTITDAIGCAISQSHVVEGYPLPKPSITLSPSVLCPDKSVYIQARLENITDAVFQWDYQGDVSGDYNEVLYVENINDIDSVTCWVTYNGCTSEFTREIIPEQFPLPDIWVDRPNRPNTDDFMFEVNAGDWVHFTIPDTTIRNQINEYYWEFGDGGWSVQPEPYYYFNKQGEYDINLEITTEDDCVFEFHPIKKVGALLLRKDADSKFAIAFPNPFIDHFTLMLEAKKAGEWNVKLNNSLNQHISTIQVQANEGPNQIPLDFSDKHLPNGLYILHISNGDKHQNLKIIKNAP